MHNGLDPCNLNQEKPDPRTVALGRERRKEKKEEGERGGG